MWGLRQDWLVLVQPEHGLTYAARSRFDEELAAFAVNLPGGVGEFYLHPAPVRRADTRCVPAKNVHWRLRCGCYAARCALFVREVGR